MKKYHKIETLYEFDLKQKKFKHGVFFNKTVEMLKDYTWVFTEKVDGTNLRLGWDGHDMSYAGRKEESSFSSAQDTWIRENIATTEIEQALEHKFKDKDIVIFGELHGGNINKGYGYSETYKFKVFDILMPISEKPITHKYVSREIVNQIAEELGFDTVPVIFKGTIEEAIEYVRTHEQSTFSDAKLEGLVGVPMGNLLDENGERIIVKIKRRDLGE